MSYEEKDLFDAARTGDEKLASRLIGSGLGVNEEREWYGISGTTPLLLAAREGHGGVVATLLASDADVNQANRGGWTALMWAAWNGHADVVEIWKYCWQMVRWQTLSMEDGDTALMNAALFGHCAVVAVLLGHDADINKSSNIGRVPLMRASRYGHESVVRLLLSRDGIDTSLRDKEGRDCFDLAKTAIIKQVIISHQLKAIFLFVLRQARQRRHTRARAKGWHTPQTRSQWCPNKSQTCREYRD